MFEGGKFQVSLYKALFFKSVCNGIKAGTLNLRYSYRFRSLDDYLIPKESWRERKAEYLKRAELEKFADPNSVLEDLAQRLDNQFITTNTNILTGKNGLIKFHHGTFSVTTPPEDVSDEEQTLADIFPKETHVSLLEVLATAIALPFNFSVRLNPVSVVTSSYLRGPITSSFRFTNLTCGAENYLHR